MEIELRSISKHYGSVRANEGISVSFQPGTIHGILGENGAGKSTLMKILAGFTRKSGGVMLGDGSPLEFGNPSDAIAAGIGMLYQDPMDFPSLTVLENFILGQDRHSSGRVACRRRFEALRERLDFPLEAQQIVHSLTVGERHQLEMLRLLSHGARVLILDEPTTGISSLQKQILFSALKRLAAEGRTVILVSHKLDDVEALCDRVTVLRQGRAVDTLVRPFDPEALLDLIFGVSPRPFSRSSLSPGKTLLAMDRVCVRGGRSGLNDCTVDVRKGEVVGLAGLEGSGQGLFLRSAAGLLKPFKGEVRLEEEILNGKGYWTFRRRGGAFLPADRIDEGLAAGLTVSEHYAIDDPSQGFILNRNAAQAKAEAQLERFRIVGTPESPVECLSGGNQQRMLLSFLPENPSLLLLENPTRGLDIESARWIWHHLLAFSHGGTGIVFSSTELDEILTVADRVLVFFEGAVVLDVPAAKTTVDALGRAIAGKVL